MLFREEILFALLYYRWRSSRKWRMSNSNVSLQTEWKHTRNIDMNFTVGLIIHYNQINEFWKLKRLTNKRDTRRLITLTTDTLLQRMSFHLKKSKTKTSKYIIINNNKKKNRRSFSFTFTIRMKQTRTPCIYRQQRNLTRVQGWTTCLPILALSFVTKDILLMFFHDWPSREIARRATTARRLKRPDHERGGTTANKLSTVLDGDSLRYVLAIAADRPRNPPIRVDRRRKLRRSVGEACRGQPATCCTNAAWNYTLINGVTYQNGSGSSGRTLTDNRCLPTSQKHLLSQRSDDDDADSGN